MKHLGDICKINGAAVPAVDCIIGGSPCQDLSIAGKRAGLAGKRSGLFMEQVRITKEMRQRDAEAGRTAQFVRPRYLVWENVPGALTSNKGKDFAAVLEEIIRIVEPEAPGVEVPEKGWPTWGGYRDMDGRWSVAWRVLDARYWGVPQRRRRIALVADFGGESAHEILFVRKSLSGNPEPGGTERKAAPGSARKSAENTGWCSKGTEEHGHQPVIYDIQQTSDDIRTYEGFSPTLTGRMGTGGNNVPLSFGIGNGQVCEAIQAKSTGGTSLNLQKVCRVNQLVRRLTPMECERLQGYPDGWTDIGAWTDTKGKRHKESSDSARYKALGNSIALPPWKWVLKRLCAQYERDATMASLFDGIGGFPLIWEQYNGQGSCLWASEIEEFPIAVTKRRF